MVSRIKSLTHTLFSFKGRLRRSDFWLGGVVIFAGMITFTLIIGRIFGVDVADTTDIRTSLIQASAVLVFMWPNLAVSVKRLHDRNQSGWWVLLSFLPVIGNVWTIINLGVLRGTEGDNRYGAEPERAQLTLIPNTAPAA